MKIKSIDHVVLTTANLEKCLAFYVGLLGIVKRTGACGPIDSIYLRDPDGNLVELCVYQK